MDHMSTTPTVPPDWHLAPAGAKGDDPHVHPCALLYARGWDVHLHAGDGSPNYGPTAGVALDLAEEERLTLTVRGESPEWCCERLLRLYAETVLRVPGAPASADVRSALALCLPSVAEVHARVVGGS